SAPINGGTHSHGPRCRIRARVGGEYSSGDAVAETPGVRGLEVVIPEGLELPHLGRDQDRIVYRYELRDDLPCLHLLLTPVAWLPIGSRLVPAFSVSHRDGVPVVVLRWVLHDRQKPLIVDGQAPGVC